MFSGILLTRFQMFVFILALLLVLTLAFPIKAFASQSDDGESHFFSLKEIELSEKRELAPLDFIQATDGASLAFRSYRSTNARSVLIFYHGAGAHSGTLNVRID